ncbi:MAG: large subunit ribosomal protein L6 [Phycisphaerales bacterium]|jgi:large subunit ribosomal protein L6
MSRIGKKTVSVPKGVKVSINDRTVTVEGAKGSLSYEHRPEVAVSFDEGAAEVLVAASVGFENNRATSAHWGTTRALIQNMVVGVSEGYKRKLEIVGVGWSGTISGTNLNLKVGYANVIEMPIPTGVNVSVEKQIVTVEGSDKQAVGEFAASMRAKRKPEPYNGKGIKYVEEVIKRKQGKAFGN